MRGVGSQTAVVRCEVVPTKGDHDLLRVTVRIYGTDLGRRPAAHLIVMHSGSEHRIAPLPLLPSTRDRDGQTVTLGFAVPVSYRDGDSSLSIDGNSVVLPRPTVRELRPLPVVAPTPADSRLLAAEARALDLATAVSRGESARLELEQELRRSRIQLHFAQSDLKQSRSESPAAEVEAPPATAVHAAARYRNILAGCGLAAIAVVAGLATSPFGHVGSDARGRAGAAITPLPNLAAKRAGLARRLGIPPLYLGLYRKAASLYGLDWEMLAAVGQVETDHGDPSLPGVATGENARGAIGPAQFLASTWQRYGLDGNGDGVRDIYDPADAIPAMASYLKASGAPEDWTTALQTYNHSDAYVAAVFAKAKHYRRLVR